MITQEMVDKREVNLDFVLELVKELQAKVKALESRNESGESDEEAFEKWLINEPAMFSDHQIILIKRVWKTAWLASRKR